MLVEAYCSTCRRETAQEIWHRDDHLTRTRCTVCETAIVWRPGVPGQPCNRANRWLSYLARRIGQLEGYGPCSIEERSIALEIAAREALAGPLPAAVEDQLREALDRVAEAWVIRKRDENAPAWGAGALRASNT